MSALQVALKEEGNESFAKGHWKDAIDSYTEAIRMKGDDEVLAVLYSNRSAAYMKCGKHQAALADARTLVKLAPNWDKAHKRLAHACELTGDVSGALKALKAVKKDDSGMGMDSDSLRLMMKSVDIAKAQLDRTR